MNSQKARDRREKWRIKNKGYSKSYHRLKRYGLSDEEYALMVLRQQGCCGICGEEFMDRTPCIDHCHETQDVRGLLCRGCNAGLGGLGDNLEGVKKAVLYLENHA